MSKYFGNQGRTAVLKKVACDQLIFAPSFLALFIVTLGAIQREDFDVIVYKFKRDYPDILLANYKLWPAVQLVNFYFVPLHYQVLVVQIVAILWNSYLSWKTQAQLKLKENTT